MVDFPLHSLSASSGLSWEAHSFPPLLLSAVAVEQLLALSAMEPLEETLPAEPRGKAVGLALF